MFDAKLQAGLALAYKYWFAVVLRAE